jgi:hypothetical protein
MKEALFRSRQVSSAFSFSLLLLLLTDFVFFPTVSLFKALLLKKGRKTELPGFNKELLTSGLGVQRVMKTERTGEKSY